MEYLFVLELTFNINNVNVLFVEILVHPSDATWLIIFNDCVNKNVTFTNINLV